jgi:translation initiation factor 1A
MRRGAQLEYRTKRPAEGEVVGLVEKASGATNFIVKCSDGNQRVCTIPGRLRRQFWIKQNDIVLVKPWVVQSNERGDIVWRYSKLDAEWLRKEGYMGGI